MEARAAAVLPDGFRLALDPGARWSGDGTRLIGGSPIRVLRLTAAGRALVDQLAAGAPVPRSIGAQQLARRLLDAGLAHPRPPRPPAVGPDHVAVVIPVRNDPAGLHTTLAALEPTLPTVVVDDASTDPGALDAIRATATVARAPAGEHAAPITLHRRAEQGGPAAARNDGWRSTGAPLVVFLDANCEPTPGWLPPLLAHFADPQVAAVAPRIVAAASLAPGGTMAAYEAAASPLDLGEREAIVRPRSPVAYVPTAALVVRRSALEALDGFDEGLTVGEDVDFVWRLAAAGWTVRYEPAAVVRHPVRPSWPAWLQQRYRYGTSAAALARRHGWAVAPAVVSPWTAITWALLLTGHPALSAGIAAYSVAKLTHLAGPGDLGRETVRKRSIRAPDAVRLPLGDALPLRDALRLVGRGQLNGGLALTRAVRRAWPVPAALLAARSRRARAAVAAAAVVPAALDWWQRRPAAGLARFAALRLVDDLAYAAGVYAGCVRERSLYALLPDLRSARHGTGAPDLAPTSAGPNEGGP